MDYRNALSNLGPQSSWDDLYAARGQSTDPAVQAKLAPLEHRAFAREYAHENPWKAAAAMPFMIPGYTAGKAVAKTPLVSGANPMLALAKLVAREGMGLHKSRSPASMDEVIQGYVGLGEGLYSKLASFGGGRSDPRIPEDAQGNPMSTQFSDMDEMAQKVEDSNTPPQWVDHKNRINENHPEYKPNPAQSHRDYMQWVSDSRAAGKAVQYPKDRVEVVARERAKQGLPTAEEVLMRAFANRSR